MVVETGGVGTFDRSLTAVRPGGVVAVLGALTGLTGEVSLAPIMMKRISVAGVLVDSRESFLRLIDFVGQHRIEPVIDRTFPFAELPAAFEHLASGRHFGKICVSLEPS